MTQMMKALVKREAAKGIWMEEVPVPAPGPNEVLIKLEKTAICGTDLHIYLWDEWSQRTIKPGLVIGHEFVGRIVELGTGVTGYKIGQRVSAEGHIVCGHCRNCRGGRQHLCPNTVGIGVNRDGAFAEYIVMPASNLWPIPDQIPSELAAFFDPYGNAAHCALEFDVVGEDVLITGAGPIGVMAAGICKHIGAASVPAQHDLARLAAFHQVEALLEIIDRQLVGQHLAQREAAQYQLGHLVPGLVHAPAIDALQGQALEDDLVPVHAGALGHDAEHRDLAAVVHAVEHVGEGARVAAHFQADVEAFHVQVLHHFLQ